MSPTELVWADCITYTFDIFGRKVRVFSRIARLLAFSWTPSGFCFTSWFCGVEVEILGTFYRQQLLWAYLLPLEIPLPLEISSRNLKARVHCWEPMKFQQWGCSGRRFFLPCRLLWMALGQMACHHFAIAMCLFFCLFHSSFWLLPFWLLHAEYGTL